MNSDMQKHITVRFKQTLSEQQSRAIIKAVPVLDGVISAELSNHRLDIIYNFPETTVRTILDNIDQIAGNHVQQLSNRLKNALLVFLETNERDHQVFANGWHRYVEDIYLHCSDSGLDDRLDVRSQTWRKYK